MKNLVLVGFMGTGKTDIGRRAAARLGLRFSDTDQIIEQRTGRTIAQIFAKEGEARFRQWERELIKELASEQDRVIATGGGIVLDPNNVRDLARTGIVICLWAEPAALFRRTQHAKNRPLLEEPDREKRLTELLQMRAPLYKAIPHRVDNTHTTVEQDVESVLAIYRDQTAGARAGV